MNQQRIQLGLRPESRLDRKRDGSVYWIILGIVIVLNLTTTVQSAPPKPEPGSGLLSKRPNQVTGDEINPVQQKSVERGLAWLSTKQNRDGAFNGQGVEKHAGITALAALAFMQAGNLPGRGQYGANVEKALHFVLDSCQESGLIAGDVAQSPMYGHGFATLFLAEVYGMTGDESVKEKLQKAIRLIERTQNAEGGWRYQPVRADADISVTICQVMALRAARDAGIKVEKKVIDGAVRYVRNCQNPDGGFSYMAHMGGGGGSGFARSSAGVAALYYAGIFEGNDIERGLKYLSAITANMKDNTPNPEIEGHFYYGSYYCVQAMFLAGGENWAGFYPMIRDRLIKTQDATSGSWNGDYSEDYATAMALIILQMPNRYLPVYAGKGPGS